MILKALVHFLIAPWPLDRKSLWPLLFAILLSSVLTIRAQDLQPGKYIADNSFHALRDSLFEYRADSLHLQLQSRQTALRGHAGIRFQRMKLDSDHMLLDWPEDLLIAWVDDSTASGWEGVGNVRKVQGEIVREDSSASHWVYFEDGAQELLGKRMELNISSRRGRVTEGRSSDGESRYGGHRLSKIAPGEMHIGDAQFTTCDANHPHFHFEAKKMKMVLNDKVVAKDVWLHFGKVPTLYSPMAMFSLKRGRASGLIVPSWSNTAQEGRGLRNIGWYWAASPWWDTQIKLSYFDKGPDVLLSSYTPYVLGGSNGGALSGGYSHKNTTNRDSWDLYWRHQQSLNPYLRLKSDVRLASSRSIYDGSTNNLNTRLTQRLTSNLSLSGSFPQQSISYTLSASADQDLEKETMTGKLPALSLRFPNLTPFSNWAEDSDEGGLPALLGRLVISSSSSAEGRFKMDKLKWSAMERQNGAQHSIGLSLPGKLSYFSLTPRLSLREHWVDESLRLRARTLGAPDTLTIPGFAARHTFSFSLSTSTTLYGVARPNIGSLRSLRHVIKPSLTWTQAPDFSKSFWGYTDEVTYSIDPDAGLESRPGGRRATDAQETVKLDHFLGSLYGSTPSRETRRLGFSLDNLFQGKFAPKDSAEIVRMDLLHLNSSSSYDFTRENFRLADMGTRYSLDPLKYAGGKIGPLSNLNMSLSTSHTFYKTDPETGQRVNRYVWQDGNGLSPALPRLVNTSFSLSTSLRSSQFLRKTQSDEEAIATRADRPLQDNRTDVMRDRFEPDWSSSDLSVPWDASLSWTWSRNTSNPHSVTRQNYARASGSLRFSRNWKLSTSIHYDWQKKDFSASSIRIYRDMHCWEGWFTWDPRGSNPGYFLLIRVKSSFLQDLKWEKKEGRTSGGGF